MIRMWVICRYFDRYQSKIGGGTWYGAGIERLRFENHVVWEKHFKERWIELFIRSYHRLTGDWVFRGKAGLDRANIQHRAAVEAIDHCLEKGYLIPIDNGRSLSMDYKGRRFLHTLPFFNDVLKEYGYTTSFVFGAGGAFIITGCFWLYTVLHG